MSAGKSKRHGMSKKMKGNRDRGRESGTGREIGTATGTGGTESNIHERRFMNVASYPSAQLLMMGPGHQDP